MQFTQNALVQTIKYHVVQKHKCGIQKDLYNTNWKDLDKIRPEIQTK